MTTTLKAETKTTQKPEIRRWLVQMLVSLCLTGGLLFLAAGRLDWTAGWAFLGLNALTQLLSGLVLVPRQPELIAERTRVRQGTKSWDRYFTGGIMVFTLLVLLVAGLDARFQWSVSLGDGAWLLGLVLAFASQMFVLWAMATNRFFAVTVRIQSERGHAVVDQGPYRLVRHPGYLGSLVYNLVSPLALASLWAFVPALCIIALLWVRTGLEDRTLQAELPGYREYAAAVRWRLVPGIW